MCAFHVVINVCLFALYMKVANTCIRMDRSVRDKIVALVKSGVRRLSEMRRHLEHFVKSELFIGQSVPPRTDARFWPPSSSVLGCMHRASIQLRLVNKGLRLIRLSSVSTVSKQYRQ